MTSASVFKRLDTLDSPILPCHRSIRPVNPLKTQADRGSGHEFPARYHGRNLAARGLLG